MTEDNERIDPVALLDSVGPMSGWGERTDVSTDAHAASILERVISGNVVPFRTRRRRLRVVTGIVVTAALGGTAAVAALWERSPDEARALTCWSEPVAPPEAQVGLSWDGVDDPVEACTPAWTDGKLGDDGPPDPLNACVTNDGLPAVIPGAAETCDLLGLARYRALDPTNESALADAGEDPLGLRAADALINERYNQQTCVGAAEVVRGVEQILDELGFIGWATSIEGTERALEPCATVALDNTTKTAVIVFLGRAD